MEDRRGPLAPDSGLIGPGWGEDCSQSSYKLCSVFRGADPNTPFIAPNLDVVKWNYTITTYEEIHDQAWINYLDLARIFDKKKASLFVNKYLSDWGRTHTVKIMFRNHSMEKYWYYAFERPGLFHQFVFYLF